MAASLFFILFALNASAQELITVKGTVYSADAKKILPNVQIYSMHAKRTVISDSTGAFTIQLDDRNARLRFTFPGYQVEEIPLNGRTEVKIFLLPEKSFMYSSQYYSPEGKQNTQGKPGTAQSLEQKDFSSGFATPDDAINGRYAGLRVINKSGMPGEGALIQLRGLRSLTAENTPLIVVDGVPYLPDLKSSGVIDGFSRSMFMPVNMKDVSNVTLLKGADAAAYGSLGSNGVLMIETERSQATATEVQIHTTEGVGFMKRRFPVMNATDFKSYMSDLGETYYSDLNELTTAFPFLKDDPTYAGNYKYAHNTDWQEEIYQPSITSENTLKVMGGDAIAKYALSVGYLYNRGVIEGTSQSKYNTRLNADINVSKNFDILANAVFNYGEYKLQEQGILKKTSPLITALSQAPVLSVYEQDRDFNNLPHLNKTVELFGISNPKAVVDDIEGKNKSYDVLVDLGFKYRMLPQLSLSAFFGLYYNYSKESMFVPGNTSGALAFLEDGFEGNTIRSGVGEGL
ncbi:MAG: SusC/RagA family protein, partial [Odoribacter splanchnicus]|nr:SusC/RagA family protein [Odoribacter splanchnicus]